MLAYIQQQYHLHRLNLISYDRALDFQMLARRNIYIHTHIRSTYDSRTGFLRVRFVQICIRYMMTSLGLHGNIYKCNIKYEDFRVLRTNDMRVSTEVCFEVGLALGYYCCILISVL